MKARFEEFYAEESFEDGKKGVQVLIDNNQYTGFNFINNLCDDLAHRLAELRGYL